MGKGCDCCGLWVWGPMGVGMGRAILGDFLGFHGCNFMVVILWLGFL